MFRTLISSLVPLIASLLVVGICVSAIRMMLTPAQALQILKNIGVALALFAIGAAFAKWCSR